MADSNQSRMRQKLMLAQARDAQPTDTIEDIEDADTIATNSTVKVMRSGYGTVAIYKLTPTGVTRIRVAVQSVSQVLGTQGYAAECFDCGRDDCMYDTSIPGEVSTNKCAGKAPRMYRVCPVRSCSKRIFDPVPTGVYKVDEWDHSDRSNDEGAIQDDAYNTSTPETRTKAAMDLHIVGFHPQESLEMNVARPARMPQMAIVS